MSDNELTELQLRGKIIRKCWDTRLTTVNRELYHLQDTIYLRFYVHLYSNFYNIYETRFLNKLMSWLEQIAGIDIEFEEIYDDRVIKFRVSHAYPGGEAHKFYEDYEKMVIKMHKAAAKVDFQDGFYLAISNPRTHTTSETTRYALPKWPKPEDTD